MAKFLDLTGLRKFLEKFKSSDFSFTGKVTFQDSAIFANQKGIRLMDKTGKDYSALYYDATDTDDGICVGNAVSKTKIAGNAIYLKSNVTILDNDNEIYYLSKDGTTNMSVMNYDSSNHFLIGNTASPTKIRGTTVSTDGTIYVGQNVVINNGNFYYAKNSGGTNKSVLGIDGSSVLIGSSDLTSVLRGTSVRLSSASGAVVTSDMRKKHGIINLDRKYLDVFLRLKPVCFRMKEGNQKIHIGFIAQDVERAFKRAGLNPDDFVVLEQFQDDSENYYGLIYEQFMALNTYAIQEMWKEILEIKKGAKNELRNYRCGFKSHWYRFWKHHRNYDSE